MNSSAPDGGRDAVALGIGLLRHHSPAARAAFAAAAALLWLFVAASNGLVVHAVRTSRQMRNNVSNMWLSSLAVTDIFVAAVVIPVIAYYNLFGAWSLGQAGCKVKKSQYNV